MTSFRQGIKPVQVIESTWLSWQNLGSSLVCAISVILIILFYQNIVNAKAWFKHVWIYRNNVMVCLCAIWCDFNCVLFYQNILNVKAWFKLVWMCELIGIMLWFVCVPFGVILIVFYFTKIFWMWKHDLSLYECVNL